MPHPMVTQVWFARSEFMRCLQGVTAEDAVRRIEPMNCLSWIVGHMASQEHYLWVEAAQQEAVVSGLHARVGYGSPANAPPWEEMCSAWHSITQAADNYLTTLTSASLETHLTIQNDPMREDVGTLLLRNIFHYWFHLGEAHAIRQMLGHPNLPQYVGGMAAVRHSAG